MMTQKEASAARSLDERNQRIRELTGLMSQTEASAAKSLEQIELLKSQNLQTVEKCEDLRTQLANLKKQHAKELSDKLTKAGKHSEDVEAEI